MTDTMCLAVGTFSFVFAVTPCKTQPPEQKSLQCRVYNPRAMITRKQFQPARRTPRPGRAGAPRSAWLTLSPTLLLVPCSPFQPGAFILPWRVRPLLPSGCVSSRSFSTGETVGNCSLGARHPTPWRSVVLKSTIGAVHSRLGAAASRVGGWRPCSAAQCGGGT